MRRSCTSCALGTSGLIVAILGIIIAAIWPSVFQAILQKQLSLSPESESYKPWKSPSVTLNLDIYLYNWTNPEDLLNTSTKPILQQLGPYRFREVPDKENITWHPENNTVSFRKKADFYFDPEGSVGSLDDEINTVNVVALAAGHQAHNWPSLRKSAVNMGMSLYNQERHVTKRVEELLFLGYEDSLIDMARSMPSLTGGGAVPFDKFGWFYTRNGSSHLTGHFNMATGADDISKFGRVEQWNYAEELPFFEKECAGVNGSAGTFYPPNRNREDPVWLFSPDMCRKLRFDYEKDVEVKGVLGYKYTGGARTVDNGTLYPENKCFCNGECVPSGVMNISACRYGTPVFMSFPHFYGADPYYLDAVEGLNPSQDKHGFHIVLEPTTGIPLDVAARFQVNILMSPHPGISLYSKVPRVFMPVLWFEHRVTVPDATASNIAGAAMAPWAGRLCGYILLGLGLSLMTIMIIREVLARKNREDKTKTGSYAVNTSRFAQGSLEMVPPGEKDSALPLMNGQKH